MARFRKRIMGPDTYTTGGEKVAVPEKRLRKWVTNFNRLLEAGYKIPAPFRHDEKAVPLRDPEQEDIDAFNNAGWWERLWVSKKDKSLWGQVDIPDPEKAKKLLDGEITEVSPAVKSEFTTGDGQKYDEVPTHIALVTHPIVPKQDEFQPESLSAAVCFSRFDAEGHEDEDEGWEFQSVGTVEPLPVTPPNATNATLDDALKILADIGLVLPADTTEKNVIERIVTAGGALRAQAGDVYQQPVPPISLSQEGNDMAEDKTADTAEDVTPELTPAQKAALNFAQEHASKSYLDRIKQLVHTGRLSVETAQTKLLPMLKETELTFSSEGKPEAGPLDKMLEILEAGQPDMDYGDPTVQRKGSMFSMSLDIKEEDDIDDQWSKAADGPEDEHAADKFIDENPVLSHRVNVS